MVHSHRPAKHTGKDRVGRSAPPCVCVCVARRDPLGLTPSALLLHREVALCADAEPASKTRHEGVLLVDPSGSSALTDGDERAVELLLDDVKGCRGGIAAAGGAGTTVDVRSRGRRKVVKGANAKEAVVDRIGPLGRVAADRVLEEDVAEELGRDARRRGGGRGLGSGKGRRGAAAAGGYGGWVVRESGGGDVDKGKDRLLQQPRGERDRSDASRPVRANMARDRHAPASETIASYRGRQPAMKEDESGRRSCSLTMESACEHEEER